MKHDHDHILVALAGQPNCGKSTIFNMITGARQHVANFPGVTVEKKSGAYKEDGDTVEIVDLPGTYSLTSYTQEERITRDFILLERPEVVVAVVDASNLERSLYLVFQLREMEVPMVLCLNMMDVAERRGIKINVNKLSAELGIPVIPTIGRKGLGRTELKNAIRRIAEETPHDAGDWKLDYGEELEPIVRNLMDQLQLCDHLTEDFPPRWLAVKLMENDAEARRLLLHHPHAENKITGQELNATVDEMRRDFTRTRKKSPEKIIAASRYRVAGEIVDRALDRKRDSRRTLTDKIDAVVLHRVLAPIILALILFVFYETTMVYGTKLADWAFPYIDSIKGPIIGLFPPSPDLLRDGLFQSMIIDGLVGGVISIVYYVPIFLVLFALIAVLEDTGYMARVAFIMDRVLRGFGLHGQSTLPLILGGVVVGGCAVPGVMATRAMKDEKARLVTILIMPLMNCLAKIPFYILMVGLFFAAYQGLILFAISVFSFMVALLIAKLFSRYLVTGESAPFVMELPPYHVPTISGVVRRAIERSWLFVKKIVTVVALVMIGVWFFVTFPGIGVEREVQYDQLLSQAETDLRTAVGPTNPYISYLQAESLPPLMHFMERYKHARRKAVGDPSSLQKVEASFLSQNRAMFLIANKGELPGGPVDRNALKVSKALKKFEKSVRKISRERRKELVRTSWAGRLGRLMEPVTQLAGFNWRINIAIISSFAAKESLVGTLGTIYSVEKGTGAGALSDSIREAESGWSILHGLAIIVFVALFPPCLATLIMIRHETGSTKWMLFASTYPIVLGFIVACLIFQVGHLII